MTLHASNNGGKTAGGRFQPGNKFGKGRPTGSRNHTTLVLDAIADGEAEAVLRKLLEQAKAGDGRAIEIVLARVWPVRKGRPVRFDLPTMETAGDLAAALGEIAHGVADGMLTPDEGSAVAGILEAKRKALETLDLERRLQNLEMKQEGSR
jgi:hypothetical protein